ncbi:3-oxoacyl-ACP synthase [Gelidibacter maritimus]|uniref:3-oxoacyl-ACP synthase n=1 Tax=Gelidibacter maritimus TaxID=2761487 RepID=A0A7W2R4K1_9FLAO|nr:3-oxoacyl-ACP synthase [Gelidibacter maritimus]MBA6153914.1 3-oxoacyl-ACP synthase [Gelidibacter maritimus]
MKNDLQLKHELYAKCVDFVEDRYAKIQNQIYDIQESLSSETKSSAGDKYETGRAMLQLEREKAGQQLAEVEKLKATLSKIDVTKSSEIIGLGSVVFTTKANYFMAISAGQITVNSQLFFAISPNTPIGLLLMGKTFRDAIVFRDSKFVIESVG